jgi:hypothetical protein
MNIKEYYENGQLFIHCFCKDNKMNGEYKLHYKNGQISQHAFYKDNKIDGEYKIYSKNNELIRYEYYIDDMSIVNLNFKIKFALLKFKDILKSKIRKPIYNELDKIYIKDISNIIGSYLFTLSKYNNINKRILLLSVFIA